MISKKELLSILEDAKIAEEKAIPIYAKHISSAVFWTGIKQEDIDKIKGTLHTLADESKKHKKMVEHLIDLVKKEGKDAF